MSNVPPDSMLQRARVRPWALAAIGIAGAMVALNIAAVWFVMERDRPSAMASEQQDPAQQSEVLTGEIITLDAITAVVGEGGRDYARITMAVVLTATGDPDVIPPRIPLLQDALLLEMAQRSPSMIQSREGAMDLRETMSRHARDIWGDEHVSRVVFTELLIT